ncbi:MAG: acyl carrier protein [Planctomycetaceae bacterium]|nr:acyl carrier protein [Planctomycetaceae bacterium]
MSTKRFLELVEEGLGMPEGSTNEGDRFIDLEAWDSVGALSVIALLDEEFGVSLDAGALQSCNTLGQLAGLVLKKAA